jgi:hypothetical protein
MKRIYLILRNIRTTLIIVIITFLLLETVLRLYHLINPLFVFPDNSDDRFRGKPYAADYDFTLNSRGFKDTEFRTEKVEGTRRIVGIGDSLLFGTVPYQHNFLTILEEEWNLLETAPRIEVFNMGIPATGPRQYLSVLIKDALPLRPDVALVFIYIGNDFLESSRKPILQYPFVVAAGKYIVDLIRHVEGSTTFHSRTSQYNDDAPTWSRDWFLQIEIGRSDIYAPGSTMLAERLPRMMYFVDEMRRVCKEQEIALYVVLIPDEVQIDQTLQLDVLTALHLEQDQLDFDLPNKRLAQELEERAIKYLDLLPVFREAGRERRLYIPRDTHWNIEGNRLAANLLRDFLRKELSASPGESLGLHPSDAKGIR